LVESQAGKKIKIFPIDRGGEYFPTEFSPICEVKGVIHKKYAPYSYTPQQNGLAERKNRALIEMVNAMILNAKLPMNLWVKLYMWHVICIIEYLQENIKSPLMKYGNWKGTQPNLNYIRV